MNISPTNNNPNFTSKIKFVRSLEFDNQQLRNFFYCKSSMEPLKNSMLKDTTLWTADVRTCSAGGVVGKDGALGFHIYDSPDNISKIKDEFIPELQSNIEAPQSALIIGSKDKDVSDCSIPVFEAITNEIKKFVQPSIFKTFKKKFAEADVGYSKKDDTWFINASWRENPMMMNSTKEIRTADDLKSAIGTIKIAPQDQLFIGDKEITSKDYPEFF